ncbi:MAG TPA: histidine kinase [Steroidobacteraceae bacterium]|jgi:sensor histidine kinase YesM|nr:histidine kinase [Steroidobacteraceae bacterium]
MNLRKTRPWIFYLLAWTLVGVIYFGQNVTRRFYWDDPNPWQDLRYWMANIYISALLTPLVVWAGRRWPLERHHLVRLVGLHVLLSILWAFTRLAVEASFHLSWNEFWPISPPITFKSEITLLFIFGFHTGMVAYWVVLSIQTAIRNYARFQERAQALLRSDLRTSQLETQVAQARLGALKAQLQPHFLFNTLNAIVVLVRQQKGQQAEETLARFSDLLRAVLADMDAQEVTLARELEYLRLYLSIEQLRFSDRLRVDIDVDPDLLDAAVPHMGLQPIVENSIRHGVGQRATPGAINIRARRVGDSLHVEVQDDGLGFSAPGAGGGLGLGLANTRARLRQLYGDASELRTENGPAGGARVTMILPFHFAEEQRAEAT